MDFASKLEYNEKHFAMKYGGEIYASKDKKRDGCR